MVTINKSGTDQRMLIWELTLYKAVFRHVQHHSELIFKSNKMPKAARKSSGEEVDDIPLHGTINEEEAKEYSRSLDNIIIKLGIDIKEEVYDAMKEAILDYKQVITTLIPGMDTADPDAVWRSIKDKVGLCICPSTEEKEKTLE